MENQQDMTYVVTPSTVSVPDDSGAKAPCWVDAGACNGDGGQVHQKHCKSDGKRRQQLQATRGNVFFRISRFLFPFMLDLQIQAGLICTPFLQFLVSGVDTNYYGLHTQRTTKKN